MRIVCSVVHVQFDWFVGQTKEAYADAPAILLQCSPLRCFNSLGITARKSVTAAISCAYRPLLHSFYGR